MPNNWARNVLAVNRITHLIVDDEITKPIREAVARRWPDSKASYLITCPKCVSVWAGLAVSSGRVPRPVLWALALSSASLLVDDQTDRLGAIVSAIRR